MSEPSPALEPFSRTDYETMYWAVFDFLTIPEHPDPNRCRELLRVLGKLSSHVRHLRQESVVRSGVVRRVNHKDTARTRLLAQRDAHEESIWSIFGEEPDEHGQLELLTVKGGKYKDVVEFALNLPEFLTHGMGGQIDRLGE